MVKSLYKSFVIVLTAVSMLFCFPYSGSNLIHIKNISTYARENDNNTSLEKRACWVSFLDIEVYLCDLDEDAYRNKICEMYDNMIKNNLNTVIFHVRPMCDAVYPSKLFPWSSYISSDRSAPIYDPLKIAVEEAHNRGLFFEAWINPYRVSRNNETTVSYKQTEFYEIYKDIIVEYTNSDNETCLSLDPAKEESTRLICAGISEILENYDVDGIHFDDYFYVSGMYDELSYEDKMSNVNCMVSEVYKTIKSFNKNCTFGISPAGNMDNARNDGADIDTWLSCEGYVDYIMPQLYWSNDFITLDGESVEMFSERCKEWQAVNKLDIPIYVGLALYKSGEVFDYDPGWCSCDDNLKNQCDYSFDAGYDGYALFRYAWLENSNAKMELANLNAYIDETGLIKQKININNQNSSDIIPESNHKNDFQDNVYENITPKIRVPEKNTLSLSYTTYIYGKGGKGIFIPEKLSGLGGIYKGIGGFNADLNLNSEIGGIEYRVHYLGGRWSEWARNGKMTGISCSLRVMDGIQIRLYKAYHGNYDIYYKVGYVDGTWTKWCSNGEISGYIGLNGYIDKIELKLEKK